VSVARSFPREIAQLAAIVAFTEDAFAREGIDPALRLAVDFALEELFTNMVKYSRESRADVRIEVTGVDGGVEVALTDYDVDEFDVTGSKEADVTAPIEDRRPGGLGLQLTRRLVDSIDYEYSEEGRRSRIVFRKARTESGAGPG
jgi:serine/threonine-protein kinase RsbW